MQEDADQWVVQNAASEMAELRRRAIDPRAPRPLPPPQESAWLIRFAGTRGARLTANSPPTAVLLAALQSTDGDERLAAIEYLKRVDADEAAIKGLYAAMFGEEPDMREAAFLALWELGASGYHLPDPTKFGLN